MIKGFIYLLLSISLIGGILTSMILKIFFIKDAEYESNQFIVPNLPTRDLDHLKIDDKLDHLFVFAQVN